MNSPSLIEVLVSTANGPTLPDGSRLTTLAAELGERPDRVGRARLGEEAVNYLVNRLRVDDLLASVPELAAAPVASPVVILELPRTGTTLISYLMACDPQWRSLLNWGPSSRSRRPLLESPALRLERIVAPLASNDSIPVVQSQARLRRSLVSSASASARLTRLWSQSRGSLLRDQVSSYVRNRLPRVARSDASQGPTQKSQGPER